MFLSCTSRLGLQEFLLGVWPGKRKNLSLANFFHDPLGLVANLSANLSLSFFDQFWVNVVALNIALRYEIEASDVIERGKE